MNTKKRIGISCIAGALLLTTVLTGCGMAGSDADRIIQQSLRSPGSFSAVSHTTLFAGKKAGQPAYIVKVEYDAQNGFGGTVRDCTYVSFYHEGGDIKWSQMWGLRQCSADVGNFGFMNVTEDQFVKTLIENNDFHS